MKKLFLLIFAAFSLLVFNACKDDNVSAEILIPEEPEVPVVPNDTTPFSKSSDIVRC